MGYMTSIAPDYSAGLDRALQRRGYPMSADDFLAVLSEAGGEAQPLSAGEREFLTTQAGVPTTDLDPDSDRAKSAQLAVASGQAAAAEQFRKSALTTNEVAALLGRAPSHVRRSHLQGDLYAVKDGRANLFPRWQFTDDGRVVNGLRRIIGLFPDDFHPLDIAALMTTPADELSGRSPVEWLAGGGQVEPVASLVEALNFT